MKDKTLAKQWVSTEQAAKLFGVSRVTVFNRIKKGQLKAEKIGRNYIISMSEVDRCLGRRGPLSEEEKMRIAETTRKAVEQYGAALRMLGKE